MSSKNLSIPESRKLVRRLREEGLVDEGSFALDFFHGFSIEETVKAIKRRTDSKEINEQYVMRATGRMLMK